jgi:EAL domain-containing protein (putative c-di-GMP-specific phosphodiesterase class I)
MQTLLIVDDDESVRLALPEALSCAGREIIVCSDLESAQLVVERYAPACIVTDVRLSGPFRFEGLDFVADVRKRMGEQRIVVMTGARTEGLQAEALARGAYAVLGKPFTSEELEAHLLPPQSSEEPPAIVHVPSLDDVISSPRLGPVFQPIVDISDGVDATKVHGYESLARYPEGLWSNPATLFEYATRKNRLMDLELVCIRHTFEHGIALNAAARLFVNVHPAVITSESLGPTLSTAAAASGIAPERVVLEITEQGSLGDYGVVARRCDELRGRGFTLALDDVGMAHSHLAHIEQIRPAYLKVSQDFGTDFERNATRSKIVRNVLSLARDFDCRLILEGIESAATRDAAQELGIELCQGYFFARPAPASVWIDGES